MSNTIQIKRSSTAGAVPTAGQLAQGELAVNLADRKLYTKNAGGSVISLPDIKSELSAGGAAPVYAARAWVNFNGTGTVAIRGSGNVSSITDNGVGDYTVNLTTAMPDANYSAVISSNAAQSILSNLGVSTIRAITTNSGGTSDDAFIFSLAIFR